MCAKTLICSSFQNTFHRLYSQDDGMGVMAEYLTEGESIVSCAPFHFSLLWIINNSTKGDDPFMLDLEWNKPVATTHPLGIDIEVRFLSIVF